MRLTVFIRDFILPCRIGITPAEQGIAQPVRFTVEARIKADSVPVTLEQTLCYATITEYIRRLSDSHIDLVETWAHTIALFCIGHPLCEAVLARVEKIAIIPEATSVGAEIFLERP
jgi:dihydroneopterin aldolase